MATTPPAQPPSDSGGIRIGDVGGSVNFSALGDIVGGDKITTITTIQISVEAVTQRPLITASPYRGLDRFEDRDKDLFFGRDQLIKSLLAQLSASNVLLVLGASGSGKSSVVRAGLLPQLAQLIGARFRYFTFVPDVNPFESLRAALLAAGFSQAQAHELTDAKPETPAKLIQTLQREGDQWLFFVDQFEEIFTVGDEKLRASFIAALVAIAQDPSSSTKLVLAMRADFLDRFSPFPQFAKIVEKNIDFVADMHADELRQAIEQPAARHGVVFEQGLVEEIIKDVQGQAGSLPLLQYTLDLLWRDEAREDGLVDRRLNTKAYRDLGGVRGALQKRGDEIYASFGEGTDAKTATPKQEIVRQIFLRLVDLAGEGSNDAAWRPVRRRASMAIFTGAQEQEILQALINQKLLVSNREGDDATVEVSHEALFTSWGRLKNWIETGKQVIFARNRLTDDARRWQRRQQEDPTGAEEELLGGTRLAQALELRARGDFAAVVGGLGERETQFLDASATLRDRRAQQERFRQLREVAGAKLFAAAKKTAADRLLHGFIIALVLALLAIAGGVVAWRQGNKARAETAKATRLLSQTDFLRATDLLAEKKTFEALAFLARACRTDPENSNAATRLFSLLMQRNWVLPVTEPVANPDAQGGFAPVEHVCFHPDGTKYVTTTFYEGKARVWDATTGRLLLGPVPSNTGGFDYSSHPTLPDARSFSARDPWILIAYENQVQIGDLATGNVRAPILEHDATVKVAQFSPDGAMVQTADKTGKVTRWDARTGARSDQVQLPGEVLALSRDGALAITRTSDKGGESTGDEIQAWTLTGDGKASPLPMKGHGKFLGLREDGGQVCSSVERENELTNLHFWEVATGAVRTVKLGNLPPDAEFVEQASFAVASPFFVTAAFRSSVSDLNGEEQFATGQVRVWDTIKGEQLCRISHQTLPMNPIEGLHPYRACLSPELTRVASLAFEDRLRISAARSGVPVNEPPCSSSEFSSVTFHPDGAHILTGSFSGDAQVWDLRPTAPINEPLRVPESDKTIQSDARFSLDGKFVLLNSKTGQPRCFNVQSGQAITPVPAEFATPDPALQDSTGQRVFQPVKGQGGAEEETLPRQLIDVSTGKPVIPGVTIRFDQRVRYSPDGERLLILNSVVSPGLTIRNAKTGALLREPIPFVSDAWFNKTGDRILMSKPTGLVVMDLGTGRELIDPLPNRHLLGAAFTADGLVMVEADGPSASIQRFNFRLERAPTLLPELAEAIAQHALNDSGIPEARNATSANLRAIGAKLDDRTEPPVFASWLEWFFAPREMRAIGPESKTTMVQYLERCIERGTPESLGEAELLAVGNKELQAKIAEQRTKLPK